MVGCPKLRIAHKVFEDVDGLANLCFQFFLGDRDS